MASRARSLSGDVEAWTALALGVVGEGTQDPPAEVWERLSASLDASLIDRFAPRLAALADLAISEAQALLEALADAARWSPASPGVEIFHFEGGPAVAGAITGFVRIEPGAEFPTHAHLGVEDTVVLQGAFAAPDGTVVGVGDSLCLEPGSQHRVAALDGVSLVYLVVAREGISMGDEPLGPDDPRA